jgi:hypothetical protein
MEGEALLDRVLENSPTLEPIHVEPESNHEEVSLAKAKTIEPIERPSPEPEAQDEGSQLSILPYFEDDFFEDFGNTSNYRCQKRPPVPVTPSENLSPDDLRESIKELTTIMSTEWSQEGESFSEEIQILTPSSTMQCHISRNMVNALYNPTVEANIMSKSFARAYLGNKQIAPTTKTFRVGPRVKLEGLGILHNISVYYDNVVMSLDFYVFNV